MSDDNLSDLARDVRRIAITGTPTARDTRTLADALGVALERLADTRRELREARRLVHALAGPVALSPPTFTFKDAPAPLEPPLTEPRLAPGDASPLRCMDCGNDRWKPLGHAICTRCQERNQLREALREAVDLAEGYYCDAFGGDCMEAADRATFDRLRKVAERGGGSHG